MYPNFYGSVYNTQNAYDQMYDIPQQTYNQWDDGRQQQPQFFPIPGSGFGQVNQRLERLERVVDRQQRQIDRLQRQVDRLDNRVNRIERRLGLG